MRKGYSKTKTTLGILFITTLFSFGLFVYINNPSLRVFLHIDQRALGIESTEEDAPHKDKQKYYYFNKSITKEPKISAKAYLVGDLDTGEIIISKNKDDVYPIASTSKLMTALVASELPKGSDTAKVTKTALATYGGNGNFRVGEEVPHGDLLYPLLLESSNDAAEVIAEYFGRDNFIKKMNQEAEKLMMSSTKYEDPTGLSINNKSSANDLFKLTGYLLKEKNDILNITTQRNYSNKKHNWFSTNQFLSDDGYMGGKSGYTDPAKETVVSVFSLPLAETNQRPVGIVLLQSNDRHKDVESLVKYLKKNMYFGGDDDRSTAWVKQKEGIPEIKDPDFVTFSFVGDIMLDRGVRNTTLKNFGGDYSALFSKLDILKKSDIVFGNLEGPASDQGKDMHNLYSFRMDPSVVPALAGAGVNVLSVANNHVGDWGRDAYTDTLSRLRENEILYSGGGMNAEEAEQPAVMEKYGMKIGFLAFSDKGPSWMVATPNNPGLLLASNPRFDEIIQNASKQVDYLVVSFHFGEEYQAKHNDRQEYLAHKAVDDGAKLVIGAHPHVEEDYEVYSREGCGDSSCASYIAYSLGNFIFDQPFSKATMQGALLQVKLNNDGTMSVTKNIVRLNSAFQPDEIIKGKEEEIKF